MSGEMTEKSKMRSELSEMKCEIKGEMTEMRCELSEMKWNVKLIELQ
jgi:hypothetical protein